MPRFPLVLCALLSGCLIVDPGPAPGPGPGPGPDPIPVPLPGSGAPRPPCRTPFSLIAVSAGSHDPGQAGYIITASAGTYRITWAGFREFRGSIFSAPGAMTRFFPGCRDGSCALSSAEDQVVLSGANHDRIDFVSFPASGKRSGFDVEIRGGVTFFDLLVDGLRQPGRVIFVSAETQQISSAPSMPFGLAMMLPGSGRPKPPADVEAYLIQASPMPPRMLDNTFGVAWNGVDAWVLDWQPELTGCAHEFRGSVFADAPFTDVLGGRGLQPRRDVVDFRPGQAVIHFVSLANMSQGEIPSFTFRTVSARVYFDLVFDGVEAVRKVLFLSGGQASTNNVMPFALGTR